MASTPRTPRRGLPRTPGGEPWPPAASDALNAPAAAADGTPAGDAATRQPSTPSAPDNSTPARTPIRRGLPRESAGEPWPPASASEPGRREGAAVTEDSDTLPAPAPAVDQPGRVEEGAEPATLPDATITGVRRGLPREPGGEPWPPASAPVTKAPDEQSVSATGSAAVTKDPDEQSVSATGSAAVTKDPDEQSVSATGSAAYAGVDATAGTRPVHVSDLGAAGRAEAGVRPTPRAEAAVSTGASTSTEAEPTHRAASGSATPFSPTASRVSPEHAPPRPPLTVPRTVWPGAAARRTASVAAAERAAGSPDAPTGRPTAPGAATGRPTVPGAMRLADFSPLQLLGSTAVLGVFALALVGIAVLLARFVLALGPGREFLAAFPGEYHLPESAPVGLPAWLNWSHFLNSFFLLFIIRTGWQVRNEKRPAAFWSPRKNKRRRISLTLWFHQAIDILWIANGVVFVVLLFATGQWMRIVPTSWEVFPNALSAALQYASLEWPTENGWVNYNSLQQLSYFAITFLAAPLAILSGVRLSGVWPKNAERLNRLYPLEWARRVHFPTMLFFVAFIVVHVALVLATGALRNLNHMYAARGSVDPGAYTSDPTGLLIFAASLLVMAAGLIAARPRVLVPIARLFGEVKQR